MGVLVACRDRFWPKLLLRYVARAYNLLRKFYTHGQHYLLITSTE